MDNQYPDYPLKYSITCITWITYLLHVLHVLHVLYIPIYANGQLRLYNFLLNITPQFDNNYYLL